MTRAYNSMTASVFEREATAAAFRASPMRKQVRRTARFVSPRIGERSRMGLGKGGRVNGRGSPSVLNGTRCGMSVGDTGICDDLAGM